MKYILMMTGTKADFDWYAKWSKEDLQANFAFMRATICNRATRRSLVCSRSCG